MHRFSFGKTFAGLFLMFVLVACGAPPSVNTCHPDTATPAYQPAQLEGDWLLSGGLKDGQTHTVSLENAYVWQFAHSAMSMPVHGQLPPEKRLKGKQEYQLEGNRLRIGDTHSWLSLRIVSLSNDLLEIEPQVASGGDPFQLTFTRITHARVAELREAERTRE